MNAKRICLTWVLAATAGLAACDQAPKPPAAPPAPKVEPGGETKQIFNYERNALERAKGVAPAAEEHERDMRERIDRESR